MLMAYALSNLGSGVPTNQRNPFYWNNIQKLRRQIYQNLMTTMWRRMQVIQMQPVLVAQLNQLQGDWTAQLLQEKNLHEMLRVIPKENDGQLRARLTDHRPLTRLVAVQFVADQRHPLERELIDRLNDPVEPVAQASRQALVRLSRGTDFGPQPGADRPAQNRAVATWKNWLSLQDWARDQPAPLSGSTGKTDASEHDVRLAAQQIVLPETRVLETQDSLTASLRDELIQAKDQTAVLERLKDAKGVVHTEALAQAIPQLPSEMRQRARDVLVERLTRMTVRTLRDKFAQEDTEIRRAAALAAAQKEARDLIPDLVKLLEDPESAVVQAARTSLKDLSGKDFGPPPRAPANERAAALAAWKEWWEKQRDK